MEGTERSDMIEMTVWEYEAEVRNFARDTHRGSDRLMNGSCARTPTWE